MVVESQKHKFDYSTYFKRRIDRTRNPDSGRESGNFPGIEFSKKNFN